MLLESSVGAASTEMPHERPEKPLRPRLGASGLHQELHNAIMPILTRLLHRQVVVQVDIGTVLQRELDDVKETEFRGATQRQTSNGVDVHADEQERRQNIELTALDGAFPHQVNVF